MRITFRRLVSFPIAVLLGAALVSAGPAQAAPFDDFVSLVSEVLDDREAKYDTSAGFRAARLLFETPKYTRSSWDDAGRLCRAFALKPTYEGAADAAGLVWIVERQILDAYRSAGGAVTDWDDFMLVRFTVLSAGVFYRCPSYNSLTLGPFSEALYSLYTAYKAQAAVATPSAASPAPTPTQAPTTTTEQVTGLPTGAVVVGEGLDRFISYNNNRQPDTCFTNPGGAGAGKYTINRRATQNITLSPGASLTWVQISNITGVDYCTDGATFALAVNLAKRSTSCKKLGIHPQFNGPRVAQYAPVTLAGGFRALRSGTCLLNVSGTRGGLSEDNALLRINVR